MTSLNIIAELNIGTATLKFLGHLHFAKFSSVLGLQNGGKNYITKLIDP